MSDQCNKGYVIRNENTLYMSITGLQQIFKYACFHIITSLLSVEYSCIISATLKINACRMFNNVQWIAKCTVLCFFSTNFAPNMNFKNVQKVITAYKTFMF